MTPEQKRKYNTVMGGFLLSVGIVAWMTTVYFAVAPAKPKPAPMNAAPTVDMNSCRSALAQLGYSATITGNEVKAYEPLTADPQAQLEKASIATLICKVNLQEFCIGTGCAQPGVTLVLRRTTEGNEQVGPKKPEVKAPSPPRDNASAAASNKK